MMNGYGFSMGAGWLWWLLVVGGIVLLVILAVRVFAGGANRDSTNRDATVSNGPGSRSSARQLLDERYAKGELSTEEYKERLRVLDEGS